MLIYLDPCCFNRPFDDQSQLLIRLQTEAKLYVQDAIRQGTFTLAWSAVMDLENAANPDIERREAIAVWQTLAVVDVDTDNHVEESAKDFALLGIKPMDALQVASAIAAGATALLTTDQANELIHLAGAGSGAVQRELKRLADCGLVTVCKIGNQKHFQANPQAPI